MKLGIALGGGGARGFAHIGVLQILQENDIQVDFVSGTSMGSIVGAMYCETGDAFEVERRIRQFIESEEFNKTGIPQARDKVERKENFWDNLSSEIRGRIAVNIARKRTSLMKEERLHSAVDYLIQIEEFSQCKIPLTVLATDILNGQDVAFSTGDIKLAVEASSSVPGFLPPVKYNGYLLSDGGISCPVPVKYARQTPNTRVIAVAVPPPIDPNKPLENAIQIMTRAEQITSSYYTNTQVERADVSIYPETEDIQWNEFERMDDMIEYGRAAARVKISDIRGQQSWIGAFWQKIFAN